MNPLTVGLVQVAAGPEPAANLARAKELIDSLPECDVIALPEVFAVRGNSDDTRRNAEAIPGPLSTRLAAWAQERQCWLLAGSMIESNGGQTFNTCVVLDRTGKLAATYRKIHLFEATLDTGETIRESDDYAPGREPVIVSIEGWRCGLSICYDVRFPELYRHYSRQGAHILFVPANFTQRTGRDHWDMLVRARAVENQCFVLAPGQCGANARTGVASHGHSMVVDPWGEILAGASDEETAFVSTLRPERLTEIRTRIPVLNHRRLP